MFIRRLMLLCAVAGFAFAQENADIPPQFENLITPELYHQLSDAHIDLLRGLPADPTLRDQATQQMLQQQQSNLSIAAQGGVHRTLDGGATWTQIFDNNRSSAIGALMLDAANGRLYVGTGEANGSADSFGGVGLFRIDNVNGFPSQVGPINPVRNYTDAASNPQSVAVFTGRSISS